MRLSAASVVLFHSLCAFHCYVAHIVGGGRLMVVPPEDLLGHNLSLNAIHPAGCFLGPRPMHERRCEDDESFPS